MSKKELDEFEYLQALELLKQEIKIWFARCEETGKLLDTRSEAAALRVEYLVVHELPTKDFLGSAVIEITESVVLNPEIDPQALSQFVEDVCERSSYGVFFGDEIEEGFILENDLWSAPFDDGEDEISDDWNISYDLGEDEDSILH